MIKQTKSSRSNYDYFIKLDTSSYKGEWIAIADSKIISHGSDAQKVYTNAKRKYRRSNISLAKVPDQQVLVLKISL